jgi:hypothetical protein
MTDGGNAGKDISRDLRPISRTLSHLHVTAIVGLGCGPVVCRISDSDSRKVALTRFPMMNDKGRDQKREHWAENALKENSPLLTNTPQEAAKGCSDVKVFVGTSSVTGLTEATLESCHDIGR